MAKASTVKAHLLSIEGLCIIVSALTKALRPYCKVTPQDPERWASFQLISDQYLRVSEACDRKLKADIQARKEFEELKKLIESGLTPDEVERTMEVHFERKGWGSLDAARSMLFTYLTEEGLDAEQAREVVENGLPKRQARTRQLPVEHKVRKALVKVEDAMERSANELSEALGDARRVHDGTDGGTKGGDRQEVPEGLPQTDVSREREGSAED